MRSLVALSAAVAALAFAVPASAQSAPSAFATCSVCHTTTKGAPSGLGPNLRGVVGRKAGSLPGFNYSAAMKNSGLKWTPAELDAFLTAPRKKVPGTIMAFPGLSDPAKRKQIIDYLATQK